MSFSAKAPRLTPSETPGTLLARPYRARQPLVRQKLAMPLPPLLTPTNDIPVGELSPKTMARELSVLRDHFAGLQNAFCCPITMEPMKSPVVVADGHTFERCALESWMRINTTNPMTGAPVSLKVYENICLKSAIRDWQETATARARILLGQDAQQPLQPLPAARQVLPEPVLTPPTPPPAPPTTPPTPPPTTVALVAMSDLPAIVEQQPARDAGPTHPQLPVARPPTRPASLSAVRAVRLLRKVRGLLRSWRQSWSAAPTSARVSPSPSIAS